MADPSYPCRCGATHTRPTMTMALYGGEVAVTYHLCAECMDQLRLFVQNLPTAPTVRHLGWSIDPSDYDDIDRDDFELVDDDLPYELHKERVA